MTPISRTGIYNEKGFTLLELIVVVFIVSIAIALALPSFYGLTSQGKLASDAKKTASILRYLTESANSQKEQAQVTFDLQANSVFWKVGNESKTESIESIESVRIPSRGRVAEGKLTVFITPIGALDDITVYLVDDENSMQVRLSHTSGRVKVFKDEG